MLQSMGLQRVRRDIMTEQQQQSFDVQLLGLLSEKKKKQQQQQQQMTPLYPGSSLTSSKQSLRAL